MHPILRRAAAVILGKASVRPYRKGVLIRFLLLVALAVAAPSFAQSSVRLEHTTVELIARSAQPAPGVPLRVGIIVTPKKGWHTYWQQPGDAGLPVTAKWLLPDGASASPFRFPVPETFLVSGLMNHVYSGRNILLADIAVPKDAAGAFPIRAQLSWLVCDDRLCVPEAADLALPLAIGDGAADPAQQAHFAAAEAALPRVLAGKAHYEREGGRIRLAIPFADPAHVTAAHFFPEQATNFRFASPQQVTVTKDAIIVESAAVTEAAADGAIDGVLRVERGGDVLGLKLVAEPGPVAIGQPLRAAPAPTAWPQALLLPLLLAILGGLLLNLMPCVFPILSLKALSLARAGQSERIARAEGLSYAAGVVLVTTALGGGAMLLARAGAGAGWAFQLQNPGIILFLLLLTLAIGLNFAGLYEVRPPAIGAGGRLASLSGNGGAFFTGALAGFVATPCTGPFMAGALGAALLLPLAAGLAVFAGLGLGLALPFLAIGFIPALRRLLPRPGAWMQTFRHILAIPMLLTALGLAWVLGRQTGVDGMAAGIAVALVLALVLWLAGLRQARGKGSAAIGAVALVLALAAPFLVARQPATAPGDAAIDAPQALAAIPFSEAALSEARARGPVFLYFTADWCLTCKVNEKGALSSAEVARAFRDHGVAVVVGDWTRPDPAIARFLERHGRAGIPFYLYYARDGATTELPQLLSTGMLTALARNGSDTSL